MWLEQGVGGGKSFLRVFKRRLVDMFTQEWTADSRDKESYVTYRCFKVWLEAEGYLPDVDTYCFRVALMQLKLGVLPIDNNMYRSSDCPIKKCILPRPPWKRRSFPFELSLTHILNKSISLAKGCSVVAGHITMERYQTLPTDASLLSMLWIEENSIWKYRHHGLMTCTEMTVLAFVFGGCFFAGFQWRLDVVLRLRWNFARLLIASSRSWKCH